jgi:formylglycine-generating enzyme required for sulfatase activity
MLSKKLIVIGLVLILLLGIVGCSDNYKLKVIVKPEGTGIVNIAPKKDSYDEGEEVTLTQSGVYGYSFERWEGGGYDRKTDYPLTVSMTGDLTLIAVFTDNVAPSWTTVPNITTAADTSSVGVSAAVDEDGIIYYKVMSDGVTAPTASEVKTAENSTLITANTEEEIIIDSLDSGTNYDIFFTIEDIAGNLQADGVVKKVDVNNKKEQSSTVKIDKTEELNSPLNPDLMVNVPSGTISVDKGSVTLSYDIEMGKYEVTNGEYVEFLNSAGVAADGSYEGKKLIDMGANDCQIAYDGSKFHIKDWEDPSGTAIDVSNYPVVEVNWYGALAYCNWLSKQEGLTTAYDLSNWELKKSDQSSLEGYRLATKDEWEYAACGGANGEVTTYAGSDNIAEVAWYSANSDAEGNSNFYHGNGTMAVGEKLVNELGIYDMNGNVWEWTNTPDSSYRFICGGSWIFDADDCEVGNRNIFYLSYCNYDLGFRLTRTQ